MVFREIKALFGIADTVSEQLEYWREYKGKEIVIRDYSVDRQTNEEGISEEIKQTTHVIRGTVEDVMSFPPGFRLTDVEEYVEVHDYSAHGSARNPYESPAVKPGGRIDTRSVNRKFVSFDLIDELESGEDADNAERPGHDGFRSADKRTPKGDD